MTKNTDKLYTALLAQLVRSEGQSIETRQYLQHSLRTIARRAGFSISDWDKDSIVRGIKALSD